LFRMQEQPNPSRLGGIHLAATTDAIVIQGTDHLLKDLLNRAKYTSLTGARYRPTGNLTFSDHGVIG
jgi:hypothetical protein